MTPKAAACPPLHRRHRDEHGPPPSISSPLIPHPGEGTHRHEANNNAVEKIANLIRGKEPTHDASPSL